MSSSKPSPFLKNPPPKSLDKQQQQIPSLQLPPKRDAMHPYWVREELKARKLPLLLASTRTTPCTLIHLLLCLFWMRKKKKTLQARKTKKKNTSPGEKKKKNTSLQSALNLEAELSQKSSDNEEMTEHQQGKSPVSTDNR
jgi:hypothetical protein